jgi:hypothetical protein
LQDYSPGGLGLRCGLILTAAVSYDNLYEPFICTLAQMSDEFFNACLFVYSRNNDA